MPLERELVARGRSVALTVPSQVAELIGWRVGMVVEIEPTRDGLIVRTARPTPSGSVGAPRPVSPP